MADLQIEKIDTLDRPEVAVYTERSEVQLLRANEPEPGIFLGESPKVIERALEAGYTPLSFLAETKYLEEYGQDLETGRKDHPHAQHLMQVLRKGGDVPIYAADIDLLEEITGSHLSSGLVCAMQRRPLPTLEEVIQGSHRIALLEDVTNPTNVGAIFRSAAALNMDAVLLTYDCVDPLYRRAIRVSMGTVFQIPWTKFPKHTPYPEDVMEALKNQGFVTAALALNEQATRIDDPALKNEDKLALLLGAEGDGLKKETLATCDTEVYIPMSHGVDSLNVAAAGAIAFWELRR